MPVLNCGLGGVRGLENKNSTSLSHLEAAPGEDLPLDISPRSILLKGSSGREPHSALVGSGPSLRSGDFSQTPGRLIHWGHLYSTLIGPVLLAQAMESIALGMSSLGSMVLPDTCWLVVFPTATTCLLGHLHGNDIRLGVPGCTSWLHHTGNPHHR
jgi:hypothetical protein